MKSLIFTTMILFSASTLSANLLTYFSKEEGEKEYLVIVGKAVSGLAYNEEDKVLTVFQFGGMGHKFDVKTSAEAMTIVKKVLDPNDHSIIELEKK